MLYIKNDYTHLGKVIENFAAALNVTLINNTLQLPTTAGTGHMSYYELPNGLQILVSNFILQQDLTIKRQKSETECYQLYLVENTHGNITNIEIEHDNYRHYSPNFASVALRSSFFESEIFLSKGTNVNVVNVVFGKDWLARYLNLPDSNELLRKYLSLKTAKLLFVALDLQYKQLTEEIFALSSGNDAMKLLGMERRVMQIIELFFRRIMEKLNQPETTVSLNRQDINRIINIESSLIADVFTLPPTIKQLATQHNISETKLKKDFKAVYGMPLYQYYQKARMKTAHNILLAGKYAIKQVATEMGFSNVSNFTIAFKKEYGYLPSKIAEEV
jgi:AraC-like DNA-binding protein